MKIKNWVLFLTIFLIGLVQATASEYLAILGAKPDFLFAVVVFCALFLREGAGTKAAVIGGLFKDVTSAAVFGSNAAAFFICILLLRRYGSRFYKHRVVTQALLCACVYYITMLIILLINQSVSSDTYFQIAPYYFIVFKAAVYTGCIAPILFFILSKIYRVRLIST